MALLNIKRAIPRHPTRRSLAEVPGHLVRSTEYEDLVPLVSIGVLFLWDLYVVTAEAREYCSSPTTNSECTIQVGSRLKIGHLTTLVRRRCQASQESCIPEIRNQAIISEQRA
jgi:hypothetical protein